MTDHVHSFPIAFVDVDRQLLHVFVHRDLLEFRENLEVECLVAAKFVDSDLDVYRFFDIEIYQSM